MNLVDMIRQTRKEYRTSMNKIAAIKLVRSLTGYGLKEARDFFDWLDINGDGVSAARLASHWCLAHWQDNEICGCPESVDFVADERQALAVRIEASGGQPASAMRPPTGTTSPTPVPVLSESDLTPSGLPTIAAMIRLNIKCRCGVANCNNEYHALATYLNKTPGAWELWCGALDRYIEEHQQ
jgi:hypothetical protein